MKSRHKSNRQLWKSDKQILRAAAAGVSRHLDDTGWSRIELARRSGVDAMSISRLLKLQYMPSVPRLYRIARAFGTTIDELLKKRV